ncbi:hypothetical protein CIG75_12905 [Tumebacillus algifaecis]|uniref:AAA+ ATPase domain-containing protein n=1 Tax=Tumebacillus algifaecis TaxID=1214604 RepID=A0A223D2B3_9BACL|nr:ATP-binding protein [Tumebacillus algifaecis]ASS75798.1 hypothetical protein CIG75_12905 [Tumebacillus algifaecis]
MDDFKRAGSELGKFAGLQRFEPFEQYRHALNLQHASDLLLRRHNGELFEVLQCRTKCAACRGYETCWRSGDAKGEVRVIESVSETKITIINKPCKPALQHFAKIEHLKRLELAGMTEVDRSFTLASFPEEQIQRHPKLFEAVNEFANDFEPDHKDRGFYIYGPPGIGKTHLMLGAANKLIDRGIQAVYTRADVLFDRLRAAYGEDEGTFDKRLAWYSNVPVLLLDEFAQERANDWTVDKMFSILSHRLQNGLCTWFTSNYAPPFVYAHLREQLELDKKIEPMISRITKLARMARMEGEDHRLTHMDDALEPEW